MVCRAVRYERTSQWGSRSCSARATVAAAAAVVAGACGGGAREPRAPAAGPCAAAADVALIGGDVWTMDDAAPHAEAIAWRDGRIVAVGTVAEVRRHVGPGTRVIDLDGRTVTPGLIDAHAHLYGLGGALATVALKGAASEVEAAERIAAAAAGRAAGEWITGRGWDQTRWQPARFPTRATLDAAVPDHPVAVRRVDGHALWANSRALALAGVTRATADPPGGKIVRDAAGEPTGVLVDAAMDLIEAKIPEPSAAERRRRIAAAARVAVAAGLTGVHEMGLTDDTIAVYREMAADGELPLRVYALLAYRAGIAGELATRKRYLDDGDGRFSLRGVKAFADGALGSRGAALLAPYADDPGNTGLEITGRDELAALAMAAADAGWQVAVHAIGDRGNRNALDAFERAIAAHPGADLRFRVEHAQVLAPEDIPRFGALGVIASMQPTHATSDMRWAEQRLGPERVRGAYAWRSVLASGGRIAAGSDFPVEEVSPLLGVYAAVTRQDAQGQPPGGWYPDQRLTLAEALHAFTADAAYAGFAEDRVGRLRAGMLADVTVFDRPLAADRSLLATKVELTVVGGRAVHASEWARAELAEPPAADLLCR
ncbi:MAG: amidohydrolase [Deltaproteobacteria bacterium]|nr:MAG: amidohydrolase [Deltaproteobacteria bacterium]